MKLLSEWIGIWTQAHLMQKHVLIYYTASYNVQIV